jgi:hypothetical protein
LSRKEYANLQALIDHVLDATMSVMAISRTCSMQEIDMPDVKGKN